MIQGTAVTLIERTQTGVNDFNEPVYEETPVTVEDVLIGQPSADDITDALNLYGKRLAYTLGIPKGDTHNWENAKVQFFDRTFQTFGLPVTGIPENIPLRWDKNVKVELIE